MAHTNKTPHFDLPQFLGTDKASWLGDINPAFLAIDTALFEVKTDSSDAASSAAAAQQSAQAAETSAELAQTQVETVTTEVAALKTKVDSQQTELGNLASGQTAQGASITQLQTDVQQAQTDATSAETQANAAQQTATAAQTTAQQAQTQITTTKNDLITLTNRVNKIDSQDILIPSQLFSAWPIFLHITFDDTRLYTELLGCNILLSGNYLTSQNNPYTTFEISFKLPNGNMPFIDTLANTMQTASNTTWQSIRQLQVSGTSVQAGPNILGSIGKTVTVSNGTIKIKFDVSWSSNPNYNGWYILNCW